MTSQMTPDPSGGSIVFEPPLEFLPQSICVAEKNGAGYFATFPPLNDFPDEEFRNVITGKYIEAADAPAGTTPCMMLVGKAGKCVGIQVAIKHG